MTTLSNIASVLGSIADSSSDSEGSNDESDSSDGLEIIEEMPTSKAQGASSKETNANSNITVKSLLTVLKVPKQSNLTRKRKIAANPPIGKWKCKSSGTNKEFAGIKPLQRTKEVPNKSLVVSNRELFCKSCREEISLGYKKVILVPRNTVIES